VPEAKTVSLRVLSISGNQTLDTSTSTGRLMLAVIGAVGQAEREATAERQRENGILKVARIIGCGSGTVRASIERWLGK
jgi:DNA invertase Pin-like site-specific DNA recombinase